jgi:formylglycine-generating enzyme required for sulfatase activity
MGVVYKCLDKVGGVRVAVKALPPELSHNGDEMEEVRENFRLVYGLSHPNIAGVRTLERDERGEYFLVMEVAEGEPLRRWMRRKGGAGGIPAEEAVPVLRQVASALDYAHGERVMHRDVKPGNIVISGNGDVKVLDFGLAAQIHSSMNRVSQAFRGTSGTGTYMAPEQWAAQPQGAAADQYALAVTAYEMVAGRLPFDNAEPAVLKEAVLHDEPPPVDGLSAAAAAALRRAMSKDPSRRFASCGAFVDALEGKTGGGGKLHDAPADSWPGFKRRAHALWETGRDRAAASWPEVRRRAAAVLEGFQGSRGRLVAAALAVLLVAGTCMGRGGKKSRPAAAPRAAAVPVRQAAEPSRPERPAAAAAAAEKSPKPPRPRKPTPEEKEAAWKAEQAALAEVRRALEALQYEAEQTALPLPGYKRKTLGIAPHVEKAAKAAKTISSAKPPSTSAEGSNVLARVRLAVETLGEEMAWLRENRPARDEAAEAEQEIADTLDKELKKYNAEEAAGGKFAAGAAARKAGKAALSAGDFAQASQRFAEARTMLSEALSDARAFRAATLAGDARNYRDRERWDKCLESADKALEAQPDHAEALALKGEAEAHLIPLIHVAAVLDGRAVDGAEVRCNGELWGATPADRPLERGGGEYILFLECTLDGTRHVGTQRVRAKDRGRTEVSVALAPEPRPGEERIVTLPGGAEMVMAWCPAGEFTMGSPKEEEGRRTEEKQHRVTLTRGFWMAKTEVTQKQWREVMGTSIRQQRNKRNRSWPIRGEGDEYPVYYVTWEECQEFCWKAGLRLPTEAEWEYACRAGNAGAYGGTGKMADMGWFAGNSEGQTHPAGEKAPNAWGLHDMHGNVSEWCQDRRAEKSVYPERAVTDPPGGTSGPLRVLRGGSHLDNPPACRSACRAGANPGSGGVNSGFRPVLGRD